MLLGFFKGPSGIHKGSNSGCGKGFEGCVNVHKATYHREEVHKERGEGVNRVSKDYGPHVVVKTGSPEEGLANDGYDLSHVYLCGSEGVLMFWSVVEKLGHRMWYGKRKHSLSPAKGFPSHRVTNVLEKSTN